MCMVPSPTRDGGRVDRLPRGDAQTPRARRGTCARRAAGDRRRTRARSPELPASATAGSSGAAGVGREEETMNRDQVFRIVRAFVPDVQDVTDEPNGITIHPSRVPGFSPLGGGWRVQSGSGIAGRAEFWTVASIAAPPPGRLSTLGPYSDRPRDLRAMLAICPGIVCRRCRGTHELSSIHSSKCPICDRYGIPTRARRG